MEFITFCDKQKYNLTLVAINSDNRNIHQLINQSHQKITLISEQQTYFLFLDKTNPLSKTRLRKLFITLISQKYFHQNIDVDIKSFVNDKIDESTALQIISEAILYGIHQTYQIRSKSEKLKPISFNLVSSASLPAYTSAEQIEIQSSAINFSRDLQDTPPNLMTPQIFAEQIAEQVKTIKNLSIKILDKKAIAAKAMNLLLAVNAGSEEEARVVVLEYQGNPDSKEKIGLVGKGITFDSGGYSLKPSAAMKGMKFDMSGAAIVCNTAIAAAKLGVKTNFVVVACLTENRIGGHATLVESVIKSMNGKTVEINNTDAEGRLVLADGITYAIRECQATKIIDVATLTGAILICLGNYMTGVFASDDTMYEQFHQAAEQTTEEIWRMPIHEQNIANMRSSAVADLSNISKNSYGGSSNAAAFLLEFCETKPFIHLDVAGTAFDNQRGDAVMLKTILQFLKNQA